MKSDTRKLTLHRPATYEIRVPGHLGESWSDWIGGMTIVLEIADDGLPVSVVTGRLDQAALQGLLRQLYTIGIPLISVICVAND